MFWFYSDRDKYIKNIYIYFYLKRNLYYARYDSNNRSIICRDEIILLAGTRKFQVFLNCIPFPRNSYKKKPIKSELAGSAKLKDFFDSFAVEKDWFDRVSVAGDEVISYPKLTHPFFLFCLLSFSAFLSTRIPLRLSLACIYRILSRKESNTAEDSRSGEAESELATMWW